jgi:succinate dehydrogenase/fumarate reductase flavoprotein subunit
MPEYDLVVCGAGAGGMSAALTAAHHGLRVLVCEATDQVGGTTSTSAGTLWLPGNRHGQQAGYDDSIAAGQQYLDALIGPDDHLGRRQAFLESAGPAIEFLEERCELAFVSAGRHPDYLELPGAARCGRALSPVEFDGRRLGADFDRVRPPLKDFLILGGMMANKADVQALVQRYRSWPAFRRTLQLVCRYVRDRLSYARGTRLVMGNALVARMLLSLRKAGVEIRFGTRLLKLEKTGNRVSSIVVESAGQCEHIRARIGVVLATGGIGHNADLRRQLDPNATDSLTPQSVRGDAMVAAQEVGAKFEHQARDFLWQPVSRVPDGAGGYRLFPHLYLDRAKPGLIAVNRAGKRFVNEGDSYHHFVEGMLGDGEGSAGNLPAYLVCDHKFVEKYGIGIVPPGTRNLRAFERSGYLLSAPTISKLAEKLGVDSVGLEASVIRQNESAEQGRDLEFCKGETAVSRFNGDDKERHPCLGPIQAPPFCAVQVFPADAASCSGLRTDQDGRVLAGNDAPLEGLYACGNDMASVMKGSYPGPGATLGPAMVFGYRVGIHAFHAAKQW